MYKHCNAYIVSTDMGALFDLAAFSLHTLYLLYYCVIEKLVDCILCISTQKSRVPRWERELRRRLLLAPDGTKARCQMAGCRRSTATDRNVNVMVAHG